MARLSSEPLFPDGHDGDRFGCFVDIVDEQIGGIVCHQHFPGAVIPWMSHKGKALELPRCLYDRGRYVLCCGRIMQTFADAFPDLAKVSLGSARPNELQSAGGANSLSVPQLSSQASIFSSEMTRPAATSARPSAIARRFALRSSGLTTGPVCDDPIIGMPHLSKN